MSNGDHLRKPLNLSKSLTRRKAISLGASALAYFSLAGLSGCGGGGKGSKSSDGGSSSDEVALLLQNQPEISGKPGVRAVFYSSTSDGQHLALYGTQDSSGQVTAVTESASWTTDIGKADRTRFQSDHLPSEVVQGSTGRVVTFDWSQTGVCGLSVVEQDGTPIGQFLVSVSNGKAVLTQVGQSDSLGSVEVKAFPSFQLPPIAVSLQNSLQTPPSNEKLVSAVYSISVQDKSRGLIGFAGLAIIIGLAWVYGPILFDIMTKKSIRQAEPPDGTSDLSSIAIPSWPSGASAVTSIEIVQVAANQFKRASGTMTVGDTLQLSATAHNGAGKALVGALLQWHSTSGATVDSSGKVVAIAAGTATITATDTQSGVSGSFDLTIQRGDGKTIYVHTRSFESDSVKVDIEGYGRVITQTGLYGDGNLNTISVDPGQELRITVEYDGTSLAADVYAQQNPITFMEFMYDSPSVSNAVFKAFTEKVTSGVNTFTYVYKLPDW